MKLLVNAVAAVVIFASGCDKPEVPRNAPPPQGPEGDAWEALAWIPAIERGEVVVFDYGVIRRERHRWWSTLTWKLIYVIWSDLIRKTGIPEESLQRCIYLRDSQISGWTEAYLVKTSLSLEEVAAKMAGSKPEELNIQGAPAWTRDGHCFTYLDGWLIRAGNFGDSAERGVRLAERILRTRAGTEPSLRSAPGMSEMFAPCPKSLPVDLVVDGDSGNVSDPRATLLWSDAKSNRGLTIARFDTAEHADAFGRQLAKDAGHLVSRPAVETRGTLVLIDIADRDAAERRRKQLQSDLAHLCAELEDAKSSNAQYPTSEMGVPILVRGWDTCGDAPLDPWGNPYHYRFPHPAHKDRYDLRSAGPDGTIGTIDDILPPVPEAGEVVGKNEHQAARCLRSLATAEMIFRTNDTDRNQVDDFWVGDVSGLYRMLDADKKPIQLIDLDLAEADANALNFVDGLAEHTAREWKPKSGYLFRVIDRDESGGSYRDASCRNRTRFGFCAYPEDYGKTGIKTIIIDESGVAFWKDTTGKRVEQWPTDAQKRAEWKVVE